MNLMDFSFLTDGIEISDDDRRLATLVSSDAADSVELVKTPIRAQVVYFSVRQGDEGTGGASSRRLVILQTSMDRFEAFEDEPDVLIDLLQRLGAECRHHLAYTLGQEAHPMDAHVLNTITLHAERRVSALQKQDQPQHHEVRFAGFKLGSFTR